MSFTSKFIYYKGLFSKQLFSSICTPGFFLPLFITFIFSYVCEVNSYILPTFLKSKYFLQNYLDYLEILGHFIYIIIGAVLLQVISFVKIKRIIICAMGLLLFSLFNILILDIQNLTKIHLVLISGASFAVLVLLVIQMLEYGFSGVLFYLVSTLLGFISGVITVNILQKHAITATDLQINLALTSLIFILTCFISSKNTRVSLPEFNFSNLIKGTELELISAFIISYVFTAVYWHYDIWVIEKHLMIKDVKTIWLYMALSAILTTPIISFFATYYNKYFLNILGSYLLLIGYIFFTYLSHNFITLLASSCILGFALYFILVCNLAILIECFEGQTLNIVVVLYFTILSLGGYFGIIWSDKILDAPSENFTIQFYWLIIIYLGYYIIQFFRRRLYNL